MGAKPTQPFVVWQDYGYEGWQPVEFATEDELRAWLLGPHYNEIVVTRLLDVRITLEEKEAL